MAFKAERAGAHLLLFMLASCAAMPTIEHYSAHPIRSPADLLERIRATSDPAEFGNGTNMVRALRRQPVLPVLTPRGLELPVAASIPGLDASPPILNLNYSYAPPVSRPIARGEAVQIWMTVASPQFQNSTFCVTPDLVAGIFGRNYVLGGYIGPIPSYTPISNQSPVFVMHYGQGTPGPVMQFHFNGFRCASFIKVNRPALPAGRPSP